MKIVTAEKKKISTLIITVKIPDRGLDLSLKKKSTPPINVQLILISEFLFYNTNKLVGKLNSKNYK